MRKRIRYWGMFRTSAESEECIANVGHPNFADLCAMQSKLGAGSRKGLGAYFDPARPEANRQGRFHIDASGYRTWGFDYSARTNPCPLLG